MKKINSLILNYKPFAIPLAALLYIILNASLALGQSTVTISDFHISQGVIDFSLNDLNQTGVGAPGTDGNRFVLVKGRNFVMQVTLHVNSPQPNDKSPVTVTATFSSGAVVTATTKKDGNALNMANADGASILIGETDSMHGIPIPTNLPLGPYNVKITASSATAAPIAPTDQTNGLERLKLAATNPLSINYVNLSSNSEPVSDSNFLDHISKANLYLMGELPIAELANGGLVSNVLSDVIPPVKISPGKTGGTKALQQDLAQLAISGPRKFRASQIAVGIVSDNYFPDRGYPNNTYGWSGIEFRQRKPFGVCQTPATTLGEIVREGFYNTTVHETAHNFGMKHVANGAPRVNGYWVDQPLPIKSLLDLLEDGVNLFQFESEPHSWISTNEYSCFFNQLRQKDPQVLIVAGLIDQNQSVTLMPLNYSSTGVVTPFDSQLSGAVQLLDSSGNVVSQGSFEPTDGLDSDTGDYIPTTSNFFMVELPLSQNISTMRILQNGQTIFSEDPNSRLLISTIQNIAPSSFLRNPTRGEAELLGRVESINRIMKNCRNHFNNSEQTQCDDSLVQALLQLRNKIDKLLNDSTTITDLNQLVKSEVIATIDIVALNAIPNRLHQAKKHEFDIQILPYEDHKAVRVFTIQSTSQGTNGSVTIENDGAIEYKPNSHQRLADLFTVTIQDPEGETVIKTVSIVAPKSGDQDDDRESERKDH